MRFTEKPDSPLYFMKGSNATITWDYTVDNREAELRYIIWSVRNKTTDFPHPMLFENSKGTVNISTKIPQMYVGRVEKIGRATLVIKNLIYEDSATYECKLDQRFGEDHYSPVQLVITGKVLK